MPVEQLNNLEINPARDSILSFLESKDDTLVMLTLNLLTVIYENKQISN